MTRPPVTSSFETLVGHQHTPATGPSSGNPVPPHPPPYEPTSPGRSAQPAEGSRREYDQLPPMHGLQHRASHLHLPSVATYVEHYHFYNFNGNCTVQQASSDGQPNMIQMVGTSVQQPGRQQPGLRVDIPPVPPPTREPSVGHRAGGPGYSSYAVDPSGTVDYDKPTVSPARTAGYTTLPMSHLPSIPGPSRLGGGAGPAASALGRQAPFLPSTRLGKPPTSAPDSRPLPVHGAQPALFPRLRGGLDNGGPIALAPLQSSAITAMPPLHGEEGKMPAGRPPKRSRLSRTVGMPIASHGVGRGAISGLPAGGTRSETNCASVTEDRAMHANRAGVQKKAYGIERVVPATNSSSPSHGEYPLGAGRNDAYDRNTTAAGARASRNVDESQSNDWEAVVEMYTTGKGTEDGVALKMITKGDGRRVSDRKLLEKRRTIGKTYECLGAQRFEAAIGYKWENGVRRKQKMYHVISRCRVVNAMRKAGETIPSDFGKLTALIDERIAEKEALKEAGKSGAAGNAGAGGGGSGSRPGSGGYGVDGSGRIVGRGPGGGLDLQNSSGEGGESGVETGNGTGVGGGVGSGGIGRLVGSGAVGASAGDVAGRGRLAEVVGRELEVERGGMHERGRFG